MTIQLTHLQKLEAEAIFVIREAFATSTNPVLLYSIGKDSAVMLHLAMKAFYPAPLPFPVLHIASGWDFRRCWTIATAWCGRTISSSSSRIMTRRQGPA